MTGASASLPLPCPPPGRSGDAATTRELDVEPDELKREGESALERAAHRPKQLDERTLFAFAEGRVEVSTYAKLKHRCVFTKTKGDARVGRHPSKTDASDAARW